MKIHISLVSLVHDKTWQVKLLLLDKTLELPVEHETLGITRFNVSCA